MKQAEIQSRKFGELCNRFGKNNLDDRTWDDGKVTAVKKMLVEEVRLGEVAGGLEEVQEEPAVVEA